MKHLENTVNKTAAVLCMLIFCGVLLPGLFIQADYDFGDFPVLRFSTFLRYAGILFWSLFLLVMIRKGAFKKKRSLWIWTSGYAVVCLLFILLIPLEPYSDMKSIFEIAVNDFADPEGYLIANRNQIPVTAYLFLLTGFGKNMIVPKLFNIFWNSLIICLIYKIGVMLYEKADLLILMTCTFIAPVLYSNHIYNDTIAAALTLLMVYLAVRDSSGMGSLILLVIVSAVQYMLRASGIIFIIAAAMYFLLVRKRIRRAFIYVLCSILLIALLNGIMGHAYETDPSGGYPVWSFLQMGINEPEFGFQDGSHSTEWTAGDYVQRIRELGPRRLLKLLVKKEFWMWSEGTYQAGRYGFGDSAAAFAHENFLTNTVRNTDTSLLRKLTDTLMKGQYYVYMLLSLLGLIRYRRNDTYKLITYLFCGYFCFFLLWEMKSRYIYSLYPFMILMAYGGILTIQSLIQKQQLKMAEERGMERRHF